MDTRFKDVSVLIWDFDKTLYRPIPALNAEIQTAEYKVIMERLGLSQEAAMEEFQKVYPKSTASATEAVALVTKTPTPQTAAAMEACFDRTKYLQKDEQLITLFQKLSNFRHYILGNGIAANIEKALEVLGVPRRTFVQIVTSELTGANKPNTHGFQYILDHTALPPEEHLMIGDRIHVDLSTAKRLGMHTCWVHWGQAGNEKDDQLVDIAIPTVYDIEAILT